VLAMLSQKRAQNSLYTVLDVGGSMGGWSAPVATHLMDFNPPVATGRFSIFRVGTINDAEEWKDVLEHVTAHGRFDFCICTHTLEDIAMPQLVVKMINRVSKAGFFATPSKYIELKRGVETGPEGPSRFRGYIHHRWLFSLVGGTWTAFPKVNFLDAEPAYDALVGDGTPATAHAELSFFWSGRISLHPINQDYLGPSYDAVRQFYAASLLSDDCDEWIRRHAPRRGEVGTLKNRSRVSKPHEAQKALSNTTGGWWRQFFG